MFFNNCIDKNQNKVHFQEGSSEHFFRFLRCELWHSMQWVSNRNTLLCLLLLSWVINYCALVSFNPCPDEKRNVQPSFSPRLMFRLAPSFEGFVASLKNLQYNFPKMRGGGQRLFGTFPKIHLFWKGKASLTSLVTTPTSMYTSRSAYSMTSITLPTSFSIAIIIIEALFREEHYIIEWIW